MTGDLDLDWGHGQSYRLHDAVPTHTYLALHADVHIVDDDGSRPTARVDIAYLALLEVGA